jgi:hypothetical protein
VTHRVFHTRLLPLLLVNGGIPDQFHKEVLQICKLMGGNEAPLLLDGETTLKENVSGSI